MSIIRREEAKRCLQCKKAMCKEYCPVGTPIPEVIDLLLEGNIKEAGKVLFKNNPLTAVTAVVCPHERNCTGHCILGKKGEPFEFYRFEEYISRLYLETFEAPVVQEKGIRIAVVGSGPAGITMSLIMALKGYKVTLFDAQDNIGGVLRYGIPEFRLSKDILTLYKDILFKMGVKFKPNTRFGPGLNFVDLFLDGYKAAFVAIGTSKPNRLGLLGETLGHVHNAIDYLRTPDSYTLGREVIIVGAGNVAMDAARTAIRKGHANVRILNCKEREAISADKSEIEMAEIDGVEIINNTQVVRIIDEGVRCVSVKKIEKEDGSIYYEEDFKKVFDLQADSVILAIGQGPGAGLKYGKLSLTQKGLLTVNEWGETEQKGVYAAGDIVTGPRSVIEAVAFTKKVAERMDLYLQSEASAD